VVQTDLTELLTRAVTTRLRNYERHTMPKAYKKSTADPLTITVVLEMSAGEAARLMGLLGASSNAHLLPLFTALHEEVRYDQWHPYYLEEKK
jgi:hypothetical protein